MNHLVPLPLTHQVAATHGNHLLHDIISSIARGFGWHLGSEAARMVPDWLVILIVTAVGIYAIAQFVKKPRSQK